MKAISRHLLRLLWIWCACAFPVSVHAQSFSNTTAGNIDNNTLCVGATGTGTTDDLERTFTVTGLSAITDLNLGLIATHTWRGDMDVRLESPLGTEVQLITPDTSGAGNDDDYNIELSDEFGVTVNTGIHNDVNDVTEPPYEFEVSPNNALSAFDGENPNGTWTLKICDDYAGETGQFLSAELIFQPTTGADLSLSINADNTLPETGDTVVITMTASSNGPQSSTPTAQLNLPVGVNFVSSAGDGTYNNATGIWSIGSGFASGTSRSIDITVTTPSLGFQDITAEIASSNRTDPDSTPNNTVTTEDDYDAVTLNVQPSSIPPALNCPAIDQFELAFGAPGTTNGWTAGDTTRTFSATDPVNATNIDIDFDVTVGAAFLQPFEGNATPVTQNTYTGGITPAEYSVGFLADFATAAQVVTVEMDIGTPAVGVGGLQFQFFDVDEGDFEDRLQFRGFLDGAAVTPILTPSSLNYVSGNDVIGQTGNATAASSAGNVTATFNQPIDRIEWDYGNNTTYVGNPTPQLISMHTLKMCGRRMADLSAVKTVEVYDPGGLGLYMTPGNEVLYKITVTNSATATASADDVDISDTLPDNLKFVSASTTGFTGGTFGSPALPAANTDCAVTPCIVRYSGGDVAINTTAEISVRAIIK